MIPLTVTLYLLPVAALLVARAERGRGLGDVALDVPLAVAGDMLLILLLSRLFPLEIAAFVARGVEVTAAAAWVARRVRRGDRPAWPAALGARAVLVALSCAAATTLLSMTISRKYQIWDRFWHLSLVPTIRAQRLPFANVYDPTGPLSYHYSGDALAAALQGFAFHRIHSSHALSLVHDLMFALSGATLGLLLAAWGARGGGALLGTLAWILTGPPSLLRDDDKSWTGYNFVHYVTLSFRPHVSVAGLFVLGFVGALLLRVRDLARPGAGAPRRSIAPPLVLLTAALSVTDEASCAMLGLGLGAAWLVWPALLSDAPRRGDGLLSSARGRGALLLVALVAAILAANLIFAGLLAPGAERPRGMRLVSWRSPGFAHPTVSFALGGAKAFFLDVAALLALAAATAWAAVRARTRPAAALAVFCLALVVVGVFALGKLDIPPKPVEAHRFITAPMLVCPLVALFWWCQEGVSWRAARGSAASALALLGLVLPAVSTLAWVRNPGKTPFQTQASFHTKEDFFRTDCAEEIGATFGDRPVPTYVTQSLFFVYVGCKPTFLAGKPGVHRIKTRAPEHGFDALADLEKSVLRAGEDLVTICPADPSADPICQRAHETGTCAPAGRTRLGIAFVRCALTPADRAALLAARPRKGAPAPGAPRGPAPPPAEPPRTEPDGAPDEP